MSEKFETQERDGELEVYVYYPRQTEAKAVVLDLMDVRAADAVRISYDFDRDGWVVQQHTSKKDDPAFNGEWVEVYFAEAWALEE